MANEIRIKLTEDQKAKIKGATGRDVHEIGVGSIGDNPAVTVPAAKPLRANALRANQMKANALKANALKANALKANALKNNMG